MVPVNCSMFTDEDELILGQLTEFRLLQVPKALVKLNLQYATADL